MNKSFLDTPVVDIFNIWLQDPERVLDLKKYEINNLLSSVIHSEYISEETEPPQYFPEAHVKQEGAPKPKRRVAHRSRSRGRSRGPGSDSSSGEEEAPTRRARSRSRKRRQSDHRAQAEEERLREVIAERNARPKGVIALPGPQGTKRPRYGRSKSRTRT